MKITQKQKKASLRAQRTLRAIKKNLSTDPKGQLITMSDRTQYYGAPPVFAPIKDSGGFIISFQKVARGIPYTRVWKGVA